MNLDGFIHAIDGVDFARRRLGFNPDAKQSLVLGKRVRRGLLNCSRQWGKSTVAAVKAVHQAETKAGCLVVVLSPSARQSGELIRKASEFVQRMGIQPRGDGDNERSLLFPNGGCSVIVRLVRHYCVSLMLARSAVRISRMRSSISLQRDRQSSQSSRCSSISETRDSGMRLSKYSSMASPPG